MLRSSGPSDETDSGVLDGLQPLEQMTTDAKEHTVTVVNSAADEDMHQCLHCLWCHRLLN